MKKRMIILSSVIAIVAIICLVTSLVKPVDVEAKVLKNFEEMEKTYTFETIISSNPYDYIDNEYYNNIVDMGVEALETLEGIVNSKEWSSRDQYVAAIAMQEITKCNLYEITGEDWSTAAEFRNRWKKTMEEMPTILQEMYSDQTLSDSEKEKKLKEYGVFSEAFANKLVKQTGEKNVEFAEREVVLTDDVESVRNIAENLKETISGEETEIISDYLSKFQSSTN